MKNPDHNFLIISDVHLSEGFRPDVGKWSPNEDFLVDSAFAEFLLFHQNNRQGNRPWKLIIAGDGFDFLQVTRRPARNPDELESAVKSFVSGELRLDRHDVAEPIQRAASAQVNMMDAVIYMNAQDSSYHQPVIASATSLQTWINQYLNNPTPSKSEAVWDLERLVNEVWILAMSSKAKLSKSEKTYGLGTTWPETVWKLDRIFEGHPIFFSALAWFIDCGHSLVIMKGNHDVDLYWNQVQDRIRELLHDAHLNFQMCDPPWRLPHVHVMLSMNNFIQHVKDLLSFEDWIFFEEDLLYVEHGNQYELFNFFDDFRHPTIPGHDQYLELPSGSFFVRYFFNKIEATFPFADNLRPISRFIAWAFQNRLRDTINLIWSHRAGLSKFLSELVSRSFKDYFRQRKIAKVRKELMESEANTNLRGQLEALYEVDYAMMGSVRGKLTLKHLDDIDELAHKMRTGPLAKIFNTTVILFPFLFVVLIIFIALIVPLLWAAQITTTFLEFAGNYLIMTIVMGFVMRLVMGFVSPWLTSMSEGEDYIHEAAEKIWEILQTPVKAQGPPLVKYLVFGHTHDPNMFRLGEEPEAPWYVNTGSWLHRIDEVESWDRLDRDFSYLSIIPDDEAVIPGLYRWDPKSGRPERVRRREEPSAQENG